MLLFAYVCCKAAKFPLTRLPLVWAVIHIAPLWPILTGYGGTDMLIFFTVPPVVGGLSVVAGLLINRWWARFLVIIGMSIWFFGGFLVVGSGA